MVAHRTTKLVSNQHSGLELNAQLLRTSIYEMDPREMQLFVGRTRVAASLQLMLDVKPRSWCSLRIADALRHLIGHKLNYNHGRMVQRDAQDYYEWPFFVYGFPEAYINDLEKEIFF